MTIPTDIVDWFRNIFSASNRRLAERIQNAPNIPEQHLDVTFVEHLMEYTTPRVFKSGWAIRIDTHYLGGLRRYRGWEIADIGMFVFFMRDGKLVRQKVALLQSKRLYPTSGDIDYIEEYDYRIGMARLAQRDKDAPSMMAQRSFVFAETSRYGALHAHDNQYEAISEYTKRHLPPVYYLFYNPPTLPLLVQVPLTRRVAVEKDPILGSRVVPFRRVTDILGEKKKGYSPTIAELAGDVGVFDHDWRLEHFMADLLLSCEEGRRFTEADSDEMRTLFFRRSGPIAATVAVTVEVPDGVELPE